MVRHHLYEPQSLLDGDMSDDPDDFVFNCEGAEDDGSQGEAHAGREGAGSSDGLPCERNDAPHQLDAGAGAEEAGHQGGDDRQDNDRQPGAGRKAWTIRMVKQPTLNEVLELRRVLYIIEVPYQQHSTCDVSFRTGWDP